MEREVIKKTIQKLISDKHGIPVEDILDDASIKDDLGIDSLDECELIMDCEKAFDNIEIPDEDFNHGNMTFNDLVNIVAKRVG